MHRIWGVKKILKPALDRNAQSPLLVVAAALFDGQNRVLVQQRPVGRDMAGLWEFPGGKIDVGETPERALIRELREELGIQAGSMVPLAFSSAPLVDRHLILLLYHCADWKGVPEALHAAALMWADGGQLYDLPMPEADRPLIAALAAFVEDRRE